MGSRRLNFQIVNIIHVLSSCDSQNLNMSLIIIIIIKNIIICFRVKEPCLTTNIFLDL
jgi:hypothetical protein